MLALIEGPMKSCGKWTMLAKQCRQIHISMQICRDYSCGGDLHRQLLVVSVVKLPAHIACGTALSREDSGMR